MSAARRMAASTRSRSRSTVSRRSRALRRDRPRSFSGVGVFHSTLDENKPARTASGTDLGEAQAMLAIGDIDDQFVGVKSCRPVAEARAPLRRPPR